MAYARIAGSSALMHLKVASMLRRCALSTPSKCW